MIIVMERKIEETFGREKYVEQLGETKKKES